jgi:hypothetical protein
LSVKKFKSSRPNFEFTASEVERCLYHRIKFISQFYKKKKINLEVALIIFLSWHHRSQVNQWDNTWSVTKNNLSEVLFLVNPINTNTRSSNKKKKLMRRWTKICASRRMLEKKGTISAFPHTWRTSYYPVFYSIWNSG